MIFAIVNILCRKVVSVSDLNSPEAKNDEPPSLRTNFRTFVQKTKLHTKRLYIFFLEIKS